MQNTSEMTPTGEASSDLLLGRARFRVLVVSEDRALDAVVHEALTAAGLLVSVTGGNTIESVGESLGRAEFDAVLLDGDVIGEANDSLRSLSGVLPPAVILAKDAAHEERLSREAAHLAHEVILQSELGSRTLARAIRHAVDVRQFRQHVGISERMEAVGRFASSTIHDLSNLLTVILASSEQLSSAVPKGHPLERHCLTIYEGAARAVALTHQALSFSRPKPCEPTVFSLSNLVSSSEAVLRVLVGARVELTTTGAGDSDLIRADPTQIEQVLFNLVANARDAMPEGGTVEIRTQVRQAGATTRGLHISAGMFVVLSVSDAGVGMDPEVQAHAFEPFFTTKEIGRGTGLGLNTVYRIVRGWDGHVQIESSPNVGTTVSVFLPAVESGVAAVEPTSPPVPERAVGGRETILVVEDEEAVGELVEEMLSAVGYQVLRVGHPALAMEVSHSYEGTIDLLLTDIVMPEMSGVELAEHIQAVRSGIRVLFMSGYSDESATTGGWLSEGMRLVSKPFDRRELVSCVRDALDGGPGNGG